MQDVGLINNLAKVSELNDMLEQHMFRQTKYVIFTNENHFLSKSYVEKTIEALCKYDICGMAYTDYSINGVRTYLHSFDRDNLFCSQWLYETFILDLNRIPKNFQFDESFGKYEIWEGLLRLTATCGAYHIPENLYSVKKTDHHNLSDFEKYKELAMRKNNGK